MSASRIVPATAVWATEPRARFQDLLAAEWIKLWSLRSTHWAFVVSALATLVINVNGAYADYRNWPTYDASTRAGFIGNGALHDAFTDGSGTAVLLAVSSIGAISVVGEYSTGLIRTTFAAVPARRSVMAAKLVVVTGVTTAFGVVVAAGSFGLTQAVLSLRDAAISPGHPGTVRVFAAFVLLAPLSALIGMGIGALVRHTAMTVVLSVAVLLVLPSLLSDNHHMTAVLSHAQPFTAWRRLSQVVYDHSSYRGFPWSVGGAWTVYAVWAGVAAVLVVATVHRRDQ